jgi:hypothetical protein
LVDLGMAAIVLRKAGPVRGYWAWAQSAVVLVVDPATGEQLLAARDDGAIRDVLATGRVLHAYTVTA